MKINENSTLHTSKSQPSQIFETTRLDGSSSTGTAGRTADAGDNIDLRSQASLLSQALGAAHPSGPPTCSGCKRLFSPGSTR